MDDHTQEPTQIRVVESPGCGNAPRHEVIKTFAVSLVQSDGTPEKSLCSLLSPEVSWDIVGEPTLTGTEAIRDRVARIAQIDELQISSLLTPTAGKVAWTAKLTPWTVREPASVMCCCGSRTQPRPRKSGLCEPT